MLLIPYDLMALVKFVSLLYLPKVKISMMFQIVSLLVSYTELQFHSDFLHLSSLLHYSITISLDHKNVKWRDNIIKNY
jgi:hypothetical protein